jgi:hypothetical protein
MMDRQSTIQDKNQKIDFLNKMLSGAYKEKFKALDTIVESATQFGGKNDPIKIDYDKINNLKEQYVHGHQEQEEQIVIPQQKYIPRPLGTGRPLPSVSQDQISALLGGKLTEARKAQSIPPTAPVRTTNAQPQYLKEEFVDNTLLKKQLKEELIREMVQDKDVRNEIMETILYELFGKDRMKKLLREVLNEAKVAKK